MSPNNPFEDKVSRWWRPAFPSARHRGLFNGMAFEFEGRPIFSLPSKTDDDTASSSGASICFRVYHSRQCSVEDIRPINTSFFANKAIALYSHGDLGKQRAHQFVPSFELWIELTAYLELSLPCYRHYPVAPIFWDRGDDPSLSYVVGTHQALAKRIKETEGQMPMPGSGGDMQKMRLRDPFGRCFVWCEGLPGPPREREFWLVAEKRLLDDYDDEIEGTGVGETVWVKKKFGNLTEILQLILHLPDEKLQGTPFRIRWDRCEPVDNEA